MDFIDKASRAIDELGPMNVANRFDRDQVIRAVLEALLESADEIARDADVAPAGMSGPDDRTEAFRSMVAVALRR